MQGEQDRARATDYILSLHTGGVRKVSQGLRNEVGRCGERVYTRANFNKSVDASFLHNVCMQARNTTCQRV